jgi:hypothetical protein
LRLKGRQKYSSPLREFLRKTHAILNKDEKSNNFENLTGLELIKIPLRQKTFPLLHCWWSEGCQMEHKAVFQVEQNEPKVKLA